MENETSIKSEQVQKIIEERYLLDHEKTWEDLAERVGFIYKPITEGIKNREFMPSSPTLMNANTKGKRIGTLSSCFPMDIADSMEDIFDAVKECALVTKYGGGVGYNFSKLRGSKEPISTLNGKPSSGPMPFAAIFNSLLDNVSQGGARKGAGMLQLSIFSPAIMEFLEAKENKDTNQYNRFNFSVRVDDEFYRLLKEQSDSPHMIREITTGNKVPLIHNGEVITHKKLWDKITFDAWKYAEPGIFNSSIAHRKSTVTHLYGEDDILSNPCLTGDMIVATADGRKNVTMKTLVEEGKDVPVYTINHSGYIEVKPFLNPRLTKKNTKIYDVVTHDGNTIRCTEYHLFLKSDGMLVRATDIQPNDRVKLISNDITDILPEPPKVKPRVYDFSRYAKEARINITDMSVKEIARLKFEYNNLISNNQKFYINPYTNTFMVSHKCETCGTAFETEYAERHKTFCSDKCKIKYEKKSFHMLDFGNVSSINRMSNGVYHKSVVVKSVSLSGQEDSFDGTVEENHTILVKSDKDKDFIVTGQCSEFVNIPYTACALATCNLSKFYDKENNDVDFDRLHTSVVEGVKFLNASFEHNNYPIEKIKQVTLDNKVIGLGLMGIAHLLYKLGIPYYTKDNKEIIDIYKFYALTAYQTSIELVKSGKYSTFKTFDAAAFLKSLSTQEILDGETYTFGKYTFDTNQMKEDIKKYGIANQKLLSQQPNGCRPKSSKVKLKVGSISYDRLFKNEDIHLDFIEMNERKGLPNYYYIEIEDRYTISNFFFKEVLAVIDGEEKYIKLDKVRIGTKLLINRKKVEVTSVSSEIISKKFFKAKKETYLSTTQGQKLITKYFINGIVPTYKVKFSDGFSDEMSETHKLKTLDNKWKEANTFKIGDKFLKDDGLNVTLVSIEKSNNFTVDLEVEDVHEYIAENGLINHNTVAFIAETSSGVEPVFALAYIRKIEIGKNPDGTIKYRKEYITDPVFNEYLDEHYPDQKEKILDEIGENNGSCQKSTILTDKEKSIFVVAGDLTPMQHLEVLSAIVKNTDLSVSKTINLPESATVEDVSAVYLEAQKRNIIGVTVYRDGSRNGVLVHNDSEENVSGLSFELLHKDKKDINPDEEHIIKTDLKLPKNSLAERFTIKSEGKKWTIFVDYFDKKYAEKYGFGTLRPFAIFINTNDKLKHTEVKTIVNDLFLLARSKGISEKIVSIQEEKTKDINNVDKFSRALSLCLRHGISIKEITSTITNSKPQLGGIIFHINKFLKKFQDGKIIKGESCEHCGAPMRYEAGCSVCSNPECGYSKCS